MFLVRYSAAVVAASVCFVLLLDVPVIWSTWGRLSGEVIVSDIVVLPVYLVAVAIAVTPLAMPWAGLASIMARRVGAHGHVYWMIVGGLAGITSATLLVWFVHIDFPYVEDDGSELSFASEWWRAAIMSFVAGAVGGFIFEWFEGYRKLPASGSA